MSVGNQIALYRKSLNMTQEEFGRLVGVSNQAVSKWESDVTLPDVLLLPKIVKELNITLDELYETNDTSSKVVVADDFPEYVYNEIFKFFYNQSGVKFNCVNRNDDIQISFWKNKINSGCGLKCISDKNGAVIINNNLAFVDRNYKKDGSKEIISSNNLAKVLQILSDQYVRKIFTFQYKESFANDKCGNNIKFTVLEICNACEIEEEITEIALEKMVSVNILERELTSVGSAEYYFKKSTALYVIAIYEFARILTSETVWLVNRDTSEVSDYAFEKIKNKKLYE